MAVKKYSLTVCDGNKKKEHELGEPCYTIGRNSENKIYIPNMYVSGLHCTLILMPTNIYHEEYQYVLLDGSIDGKPSTNGTWIAKSSWQENKRLGNKKTQESRLITHILEDRDVVSFSSSRVYPHFIFNITLEGASNGEQEGGTIPGHDFNCE